MSSNKIVELIDAGVSEDVDILQHEYENAAELIGDLADRIAGAVGTEDAAEIIVWMDETMQKLNGFEMTRERRDELFAICREAGFTISDAAELAGIGYGTAHRNEVEKNPNGFFSTNADKEAAVRDYVAHHPDASDREVADKTGVHWNTVGAIKKRSPQITPETILDNSPEYQQAKKDAQTSSARSAAATGLARLLGMDAAALAAQEPISAREREIAWADRIIAWFSAYQAALRTSQLRVVER